MKGRLAQEHCVDAVLPLHHTGNTVPTLTVKISKQLRARLAAAAKRRRTSQSELVRQAIEEHLREPIPAGESAYDLIKDLIESLPAPAKNEPLVYRARNSKKLMEGFGLDNAQLRARGRGSRHR